ncbi:Gfo/Idh/MocA family protein [Nonomuraea ferruginea]
MGTTGVAIVGCGNIAQRYAADLASYPEIELRGVQDVDPARAGTLAAAHGVRAYATMDELLADPGVDIVVNLTAHKAHYEVIRRALEAGPARAQREAARAALRGGGRAGDAGSTSAGCGSAARPPRSSASPSRRRSSCCARRRSAASGWSTRR